MRQSYFFLLKCIFALLSASVSEAHHLNICRVDHQVLEHIHYSVMSRYYEDLDENHGIIIIEVSKMAHWISMLLLFLMETPIL